MKRTLKSISAVLTLVQVTIMLLQGEVVRAETIVLTAVADTRISPGEDRNWNHLFSNAVYHEPGNVQRSMVQFDLSQIPEGAQITSATLRLTERDTFFTSEGQPTWAFRVTKPWIETQATGIRASASTLWDYNGGDYVGTTGVQGTNPYAIAYDIGTAPILFMDLTSLVQAWVEDDLPNNGLMLSAPIGNHLHFYARELGAGTAPLLTITYEQEFMVNVTSFIPDNHLLGPPNSFCIDHGRHRLYFHGDDRVFSPFATSFRTRQLVTVIPDATIDADGLKSGSIRNLVGETRAYAPDALDDGVITEADDDGTLDDCHLLVKRGFASTANMHVLVTRVSANRVSVRLHGGAGNPLVRPAADIDWDFTITIDTSGPKPFWTLTGSHDGFPAHEVYINNTRLLGFAPASTGLWDLLSLLPPLDQHWNVSGYLP